MTFPLWYLLLPYAIVVLGTGIFLFFNLYHIAVFGIQASSTTFLLVLYTISYAAVLVASVIFLSSYDWSAVTSLGDIIPFLQSSSGTSTFGL